MKKTRPRNKPRKKELAIPKKVHNQKYSAELLLRIKELYDQGLNETQVCEAIGLRKRTWYDWMKRYPELKKLSDDSKAIRKSDSNPNRFLDYVYRRMTPEMQAYWDKLSAYQEEPTAQLKIEALMVQAGKPARQHLMIHALVAFNFNLSIACSMVNITDRTLKQWLLEPEFNDLYNEVIFHRKNWLEAALFGRIAAGDTAAIIFANKTLNADRGYNPAKEVKGTINHDVLVSQATQDFDDLPLELRKGLLEYVEKKNRGSVIVAPVEDVK